MRKSDAAFIAARKTVAPPSSSDTPIELICAALTLALLVLTTRIISVW